jgi:hypothetical protein
MKNKITISISYSILAVAGFLIVLGTYWLVWPYKVLEVNKVEIVTPIVTAGDDLKIFLDTTKFTNVAAKVLTEILDTNSWGLPQMDTNLPRGRAARTIRIKVPSNATSGNNYKIHRTYIFKVNPIREIMVDWTSLPFTVIGIDAKIQQNENKQVEILKNQKMMMKEMRKK